MATRKSASSQAGAAESSAAAPRTGKRSSRAASARPAPARRDAPAPKKKAAAPRARSRSRQNDALYSDPALRERLKEKVQAGSEGGRAGQWSARKAQLLATEYKKAGGGYTKSKAERAPAQRHLQKWTQEDWQTADHKKAVRGDTTARYLPKKAWEDLSPAERKATDQKKRAATSRSGKQFVANPPAARAAGRRARQSDGGTDAGPAAGASAARTPRARRTKSDGGAADKTGSAPKTRTSKPGTRKKS